MIKRVDGWLSARIGDELVMMSASSGAYLGMNEAGAFVWDLLDAPREAAELCEKIAGSFEVTVEACRPDIEAFLAALEARGAVQRVAP